MKPKQQSAIKTYRTKVFPNIKNWTSPQNKYRNEKDVRKLSYWEWFWLHPSAYSLFTYSINVSGSIFGICGGAYFGITSRYIPMALFLIIGLTNLKLLYQKIKNRKIEEGLTLYDIFMRDYDAPINKTKEGGIKQ